MEPFRGCALADTDSRGSPATLVLPGTRHSNRIWATTEQVVFQDDGVDGVSVTDSRICDADIEQMRGASHLVSVVISGGPGVTNDVFRALCTLSSLRFLTLEACHNVTDDGLRQLGMVSTLTEVWIVDCRITDVGIAHLATLPRLEVLHVRECPNVVGTSFEDLSAAKCLRELSVYGTNVDDRIGKYVHGFSGLETLCLTHTKVTDQLFSYLEHLKSLTMVDVTGTGVSLEAIKEFVTLHPNVKVHMYY